MAGVPHLYVLTIGSQGADSLADGLHHLTARVQIIDPAKPTTTGFGDRSASLDITVDTAVPPNYFGLISQADTTQGLGRRQRQRRAGQSQPAGHVHRPHHQRQDADLVRSGRGQRDRSRLSEHQRQWRACKRPAPIPTRILGETVAVPLDGTNQFPNGEWTFTVTRDLNDPTLGLGHDGLRTFFVNGRRPGGQRDPGRQRRLAATSSSTRRDRRSPTCRSPARRTTTCSG